MYQQKGLKCPKCGDVIYSNSRHDMEWCLCGALFIDGGWDYTRWGGDGALFGGTETVTREVDRPKLPWYYSDEPDRIKEVKRWEKKQRGLQPTPA